MEPLSSYAPPSQSASSVAAPPQKSNTMKHTIVIGKNCRLVDLNVNLTNFEIDFLVNSTQNPEAEFEALVVSQAQLDDVSLSDLELKKTRGRISGKLRSDENIFQNYFLCLRCLTQDIVVDVIIDSKEIPPSAKSLIPAAHASVNGASSLGSSVDTAAATSPVSTRQWIHRKFCNTFGSGWMGYVKLTCLLLLIFVVLYFFLIRPLLRKNSTAVSNKPVVISPPLPVSPSVPPSKVVAPVVEETDGDGDGDDNELGDDDDLGEDDDVGEDDVDDNNEDEDNKRSDEDDHVLSDKIQQYLKSKQQQQASVTSSLKV